MTTQWSGNYYNGRTAGREQVSLSVGAGALIIRRPDGTSLKWPLSELRQSQGRLPGERLRIDFGDDVVQSVLVEEPGLADAIGFASPDARRAVRANRTRLQIAAWTAVGVAVVVSAYIWAAPLLADWTARRMPVSFDVAMGQSLAERLPEKEMCSDSVTVAALATVLDRLVPPETRGGYEFRIVVMREPVVNAFAAPGGFIVVNSGLLNAARTPEELAGVLAHEAQHVLHRHSTRAILREVPLRAAVSILSNGTGADALTSTAASIGALRYRRDDEAEADRDGLVLLERAHVDATGMVTFMRRLGSEDRGQPRFVSYLSSHPRTADRVAELSALASAQRGPTTPLLDSATWKHVRASCRASQVSKTPE